MPEDKILIVEDDAILAIHLEDVLTRQGYSVLKPVATGEDAIKVVKILHPALILMDIELGGKINGITAAERIGEIDDTPIVFLTGFSHDPLLQQAKITAPYGYLVKPVPERELAATIEMAFYKHKLDHMVRESELKYRSLVEQASDGIFLTDRFGNFIEVNTAECKLLGYSYEELLLLNMEDLVPEEDLISDPLRIKDMLDGKTIRTERRMRRKDGSIIYVEISGKVLDRWEITGNCSRYYPTENHGRSPAQIGGEILESLSHFPGFHQYQSSRRWDVYRNQFGFYRIDRLHVG